MKTFIFAHILSISLTKKDSRKEESLNPQQE